MRIYALYLPQFHAIPENDEWWGKGFTEWVNVKNGKALFNGHYQPKVPLNEYYYNLLDRETVEWQTSLMKKYNIDGMIYYHYYFNGKLLLEKPAENLLKWKNIDQPFFFNWANHSWNRAWKGSREILLEQTYGTEKDWKKHFEYLLPFFKDDRYVKIGGKPVFMIYSGNFPEKDQMLSLFDKWCRDEHLPGIYIIEEITDFGSDELNKERSIKSSVTEKLYITEPTSAKVYSEKCEKTWAHYKRLVLNKLNQKGVIKWTDIRSGDRLYDQMIRHEPMDNDLIHGIFFEWDNTPRHSNRGFVITPVSKEKFFEYMNKIKSTDFVVTNAWNEWAEGMMLEPTEKDRYKYLEWIKEWKEKNEI